MAPQISGVDASSDDVEAIVRLVATVEHAQQHALPDEFMSVFHKDAVWTTAHGKSLVGFDEISEFTHRVLPGAINQETTATYEAEHILFIRPNVAAVKVHQRPIHRDGTSVEPNSELPPGELLTLHPDTVPGAPLYVLAKEDGRWMIHAAQNTKVLQG